jgi:DNA-binding NarL/FixJ family response regulator
MITVFIIDDHEMIIEGIQSLLSNETDIEWMGSAKRPDELMNLLRVRQPDILLMDINLPQRSGIDLCLEVREKYPAIRIIGLSTSFQPSVIRKMKENGASGYLLKDVTKKEIIAAFHEVCQGREYVSRSVSEVLRQSAPPEGLPLLTKREKEILGLIAEGMTNQAIADKLFLSYATVETHRKHMLTKFGVKNTAALVKMAVINHLI